MHETPDDLAGLQELLDRRFTFHMATEATDG